MASSAAFMVRVNGSPELVKDLEGVIKAHAAEMKVESSGPAEESSRLKLGLAEVATLVAVLNGAATLAKLAYSIFTHLKKTPTQRVTIQTPLRTIEISSSDAISEEHVREMLAASAKL